MAPLCISSKASVRPTVSLSSSRPRPVLAAPTRLKQNRILIKRFSSDSGEKNDDKLVSDSGEILQGRQEMKTSPMSDDKRAQTPEQGGAPEGDRAVAGQAYQPTGDSSDVASPESGEKLTGSVSQSAGELAQQEEKRNEDRTPLQD